jgi:hypothetical protein
VHFGSWCRVPSDIKQPYNNSSNIVLYMTVGAVECMVFSCVFVRLYVCDDVIIILLLW